MHMCADNLPSSSHTVSNLKALKDFVSHHCSAPYPNEPRSLCCIYSYKRSAQQSSLLKHLPPPPKKEEKSNTVMEQTILKEVINSEYNEEEEAQAAVDVWKVALGFSEMALVKCDIDLGIDEVLERNGGSMTILELSSALENFSQDKQHNVLLYLTFLSMYLVS